MTTQALLPNSTISNTGASLTGAATVHAALSDSSNTTYISSTGSEIVLLDLETFTKPAGSVIKDAYVGIVGRQDGYPGGLLAWIGNSDYYWGGDYNDRYAAVSTGPAWESSWTSRSSGYTACPDLAQTTIDGLRIVLQLGNAVSCSRTVGYIRYVLQPVVAIDTITPDPVTGTNILPITWVNTLDSDGGAQTRYEVKAFTDAQYGAGGFDPDTSTPYWTSGEVASSALGRDVGPLANDTYRIYVRTAQTVNGAYHWSDWDYDTVTVNVSTSDVDTVTPTPSNANANISVVVARDTGSEAWDYIEVQRSVDAGATWGYVRGAAYVDATGSANSFTIVDYETGNDQDVLYRARATRIVSTLPITGDWVASSPAVAWASTSTWMKAPLAPSKNQAVDVVFPFEQRLYATRVGVFGIIGSATSVAISDVISDPSQTMQIDTTTEAEAETLLDLFREAVVYYCPAACDGSTTPRYLAITDLSMTPTPYRQQIKRRWTVSVVTVDAPGDESAGAS